MISSHIPNVPAPINEPIKLECEYPPVGSIFCAVPVLPPADGTFPKDRRIAVRELDAEPADTGRPAIDAQCYL